MNTRIIFESTQLERSFLCAISESYKSYREHGASSTKKLRPLHQWVADQIKEALGAEYSIQSMRIEGKDREKKISGAYYDKNVDVCITEETGKDAAIVSIKFITSNYGQNANNYFEHLMGETANLRRKGIIVGHFMVLPDTIPYLKKDGATKKFNKVSGHHIQKYIKLEQDENNPHRPDAIAIGLISLPLDNLEDTGAIKMTNLAALEDTHQGFNKDIIQSLTNNLSMTSFFTQIITMIKEGEK